MAIDWSENISVWREVNDLMSLDFTLDEVEAYLLRSVLAIRSSHV